ncbi:MAG: hypothetical protein K1X79_06110 [Oligoflexia bacterium]|nr:hypothetical protein [Oligoflexia bacterium]
MRDAVRNGRVGFALLVGSALVSLILTFAYVRHVLGSSRAEVGAIFGPLGSGNLKALSMLNIEGGVVGEFFDAQSLHKISLMLVGPTISDAHGPIPDVLDVIDSFRRSPDREAAILPVACRYVLAQFNTLSAEKANKLELSLGERRLLAEAFETSHEAHYLLGVVNLSNKKQLLYLALKKGGPVDAQYVAGVLAKIPALVAAHA